MQGIYFFVEVSPMVQNEFEKSKWLAQQKDIDSFKILNFNSSNIIQPFNPNFISDYKGYKLGMSILEIDRLHAFRKQNKFINSTDEFQNVTQISDSLLNKISPYFKFPDWVNSKQKQSPKEFVIAKKKEIGVLDINTASKEDLMRIYGIGDKISDRILEHREKLGCFVSMEQMDAIWGISPEVVKELNKYFFIKNISKIKKIKINEASVKDLSTTSFFNYSLAKEIVLFRSMNGDITKENLPRIKSFPLDKIKIIELYLDF